MDKIDHHILKYLQDDARLSYAELGRRVGLSAPAVAERVQKMEDECIITGYHAAVDPERLGRGVQAVLHLQVDRAHFRQGLKQIQKMPDVRACYRTTGSSSLMMIVAVPTMQDLEGFIDQLLPYGEPVTQMILSTPIPHRTLPPA